MVVQDPPACQHCIPPTSPDVTTDREATGGNWQKDTEEADKE